MHFLTLKTKKFPKTNGFNLSREHNHNISSWQKARRENIKDALRSVTDSLFSIIEFKSTLRLVANLARKYMKINVTFFLKISRVLNVDLRKILRR